MDWFTVFDRYGFPVAILGLMLTGGVTAAWLIWKDIVIPLRDRGLTRLSAFFDRLENFFGRAERYDASNRSQLDRQEEMLWDIREDLREVNQRCGRIEMATAGTQSVLPRRTRPPRQPPTDTPPPVVRAGV